MLGKEKLLRTERRKWKCRRAWILYTPVLSYRQSRMRLGPNKADRDWPMFDRSGGSGWANLNSTEVTAPPSLKICSRPAGRLWTAPRMSRKPTPSPWPARTCAGQPGPMVFVVRAHLPPSEWQRGETTDRSSPLHSQKPNLVPASHSPHGITRQGPRQATTPQPLPLPLQVARRPAVVVARRFGLASPQVSSPRDGCVLDLHFVIIHCHHLLVCGHWSLVRCSLSPATAP